MQSVAEKARAAYGELPNGWTRRRLRFDVQLNPKKSSLKMGPDEHVSFVPMDAVGEYGGMRLEETRELADVYDGYTYFEDGDLCVAKITPCFENGKGALAEGLTNGVGFGTTELHVVRPGDTVDRRFLFYVTIADDFRKLGESEMYGAGGQKRIDERFIKDWMPPLPPLDTQRRIARFLDENTALIDGLIEKKRTLLDRLAEKRAALITRAVTNGLDPNVPMKPSGIEWLGDIPAHWRILPLKRLRTYITSGSRGWAAYYSDEGDPFIRMTNVTSDGIELDTSSLRFVDIGTNREGTRTAVESGDILVTITAELGAVAIVRSPMRGAFINQHLALVRVNPRLADSEYLANLLTTEAAQVQFLLSGYGGTKQGLGFEQIDGLIVLLPPKEEQVRISAHCESTRQTIDGIRMQVRASVDSLDEYRSAVIAAAVTGQLPGLR